MRARERQRVPPDVRARMRGPEEAIGRAARVEHGGRLGGGGGGGWGGRRGGRGGVQPGPGQRAAAAAGGAGAGDRGGAAVRGDGDPGAVQGEAERAPAGPPDRPVRRRRAEGGGRALGPDPLPGPGGDRAAARGLQLRGPQGLPDGPQPRRLRPPQAGRAQPRLRAAAPRAGAPLSPARCEGAPLPRPSWQAGWRPAPPGQTRPTVLFQGGSFLTLLQTGGKRYPSAKKQVRDLFQKKEVGIQRTWQRGPLLRLRDGWASC